MSCYQFQPLRRTNFRLARKACQFLGGDLVNIASSVEQSFVMQNTYKNSWIGKLIYLSINIEVFLFTITE